jgi:hypothetical protein
LLELDMTTGADARAILSAYKEVMCASWPDLHPHITERSKQWSRASEAELTAELEEYLREASLPGCNVRIFWKLGKELRFGGFNQLFAADAGMPPDQLVGLDDYDKRLPWFAQAAKYRTDDEEVFTSGRAKLDILERQRSSSGIIWVRAGKAPIRGADGQIHGILGMYEVLDSAVGRRLFTERTHRTQPD